MSKLKSIFFINLLEGKTVVSKEKAKQTAENEQHAQNTGEKPMADPVFFVSLVGVTNSGKVECNEHIFDIYTKRYDALSRNVQVKSAKDLLDFNNKHATKLIDKPQTDGKEDGLSDLFSLMSGFDVSNMDCEIKSDQESDNFDGVLLVNATEESESDTKIKWKEDTEIDYNYAYTQKQESRDDVNGKELDAWLKKSKSVESGSGNIEQRSSCDSLTVWGPYGQKYVVDDFEVDEEFMMNLTQNDEVDTEEPNIYKLLEFFIEHHPNGHYFIDECPFLSSYGK